MGDWSAGDWAQIASAAFTAVAAMAALFSVLRIAQDRRNEVRPDLHMEIVVDVPNDETRLVVVNLGGPARDVRVFGSVGTFGFLGVIPPTSQWKPGESRTVRLSIPAITDDKVNAFVEGRDMGRRQLIVGTIGGKTYRWPWRKTKQWSSEIIWRRLFPGELGPLDMPDSPIHMETVQREL